VEDLESSTDLLVVGHFALDHIYKNGKFIGKFLGGPPTYVSLAAAKLGAKVSVLSKVGWNFKSEYVKYLISNGIELPFLKRVEDSETTRFELRYSADWKRWLRLKAVAPSIKLEDLPKHLKVKAVHVAPIVNEIQPNLVRKLRESSEILSIDPQGFVRNFDKEGNVSLKKWQDFNLMKLVEVFKSSLGEIRMITEKKKLEVAMKQISDFGAKVVIVTLGAQGSILLSEDNFYKIPAASSRVIRDVTGAGDSYIGGFLAEYIRGKDAVWCACVGSAAASFVVEELGSSGFGDKEKVYQRAKEVYEKVSVKRN